MFQEIRILRFMAAAVLGLASIMIGAAAAETTEGRPDLLIADFENKTYPDGWMVAGTAFGNGPARGTLPGQMHVSGYLGNRLVNTFLGGDDSIGTLTSVPFQIERDRIGFLIGGGKNEKDLRISLLVDGKIVRSETGPNDRPGGSEELAPAQWDVQEFAGKTAKVEIVDAATGGWGHINVDQIVQTDRRLPQMLQDLSWNSFVTSRYLILPVKNGAQMRHMKLFTLTSSGNGNATLDREFDIELAPVAADADYRVWIDMEGYQGTEIRLIVDQIREDQLGGFESIMLSDTLPDANTLYHEADRPQFHLTSRRGWNNDPNGMVYYQGKYHLFWQHNPFGWNWGNMHWGHAVSTDMLHWEELGDALVPDSMGPMFSGSAVVDWNNTSSFGTKENPPMVAAYTAAGSPTIQGIAYSTDGKTLVKWDGNPAIGEISGGNRDPKLFWYAPGEHWVMVLYVDIPEKERRLGEAVQAFYFFSSPDLKKWTLESRFHPYDMFECPDMFELPVLGPDGQPQKNTDGTPQTRWVVYGADGRYVTGDFDGKEFTANGGKQTLWYGRFYAAQSFSDTPDGRRIQIGWGQGITFPGMPFNQQMTIPVELTLHATAENSIRMCATPIRELESLRNTDRSQTRTQFGADETMIRYRSAKKDAEELWLTFELTDQPVELTIHDVPMTYDPMNQEIRCGTDGNRVVAPLVPTDGRISLRILVDTGSIEIFDAIHGTVAMSVNTQTANENLRTRIPVRGPVRLLKYERFSLKSVWKEACNGAATCGCE